MKIAVLSDSHDHVPLLKAAVAGAVERGVEAILHCGDIVAASAVERFHALPVPMHVIHGNNMGDPMAFARMFARTDCAVTYHGQDADLTLGGRRIFIVHYPHYARGMAATGDYDLVCCGHSHEPGLDYQPNLRGGETLVLNPGPVCGIGGPATYAVVDLETLKAEFVELRASEALAPV